MLSKDESYIKQADVDDIELLVDYQIKMAKETEDKELNGKKVATCLDTMFKTQIFGECFVKRNKTHKGMGSTMITFAYDLEMNKTNYWFQSVYVDKEFRKQGVFTSMYRFVEQRAKEKGVYALYLYVDKDNHLAISVYEKLGMKRLNKLIIEKDFFFGDGKGDKVEKPQYIIDIMSIANKKSVKGGVSDLLKLGQQGAVKESYTVKKDDMNWFDEGLYGKFTAS